ncbi:hypothetical protein [Gracilibacillus oryzae]|uniref:hypothetical protein n=1 Tax=Gracilibacillus oryzae TaxID=1672701 RepID=UPI001885F7BD|nr:hypothetical protein [Gracilibacillus oryzae]
MNRILFFLVLLIIAGSFVIDFFVDNESMTTMVNIIALIALIVVAFYLRSTAGRGSTK